MKQPSDIQHQYYADTATLYDSMHVRENYEHHIALKYVSSFVTLMDLSNILDVGCGTGRVVKYFLEKGVTVHGIEPVQALLDQIAQTHGIPTELLTCGSGEHLPFEDGCFEAVCAFGVLHHVPNPNVVVKEMIRVAKKAIFLSDANRFGQGSMPSRWVKLLLSKMNLWGVVNLIKTGGKGYTISEGDGLAYSYSVFDSFKLLAEWADRVILIPTAKEKPGSWYHPLLTARTVLVCAIREDQTEE